MSYSVSNERNAHLGLVLPPFLHRYVSFSYTSLFALQFLSFIPVHCFPICRHPFVSSFLLQCLAPNLTFPSLLFFLRSNAIYLCLFLPPPRCSTSALPREARGGHVSTSRSRTLPTAVCWERGVRRKGSSRKTERQWVCV